MAAKIICLLGLVFAIIAVAKWLRQGSDSGRIPPVINNTNSNPPIWKKNSDFSPLARDRQEVLEIWEKCANDPSFPPPIPPIKPTVYFGNETVSDIGGSDGETD
jgi:hypothetical protein